MQGAGRVQAAQPGYQGESWKHSGAKVYELGMLRY